MAAGTCYSSFLFLHTCFETWRIREFTSELFIPLNSYCCIVGSFSWVRIMVWNPKFINFGVGFRVLRFLKEPVWFQWQSFLTRWEGHTGRSLCSVWPKPSACCYLHFVEMAANSWSCTRCVLVSSGNILSCTSSLVLPFLEVFIPL